MKKYDYIVVGAGISGAVAARILANKGYHVLVVEKRNYLGGNCNDYTCCETGINIHRHGAHIFHTNNEEVWEFVNRYADFNNYVHTVQAIGVDNNFYSMPFNMHTFTKLWRSVFTIEEAEDLIKVHKKHFEHGTPRNLEEQCQNMVGQELYELLVREYTKKQWNEDPKKLSPDIIKRIPLRFNWDNRYFTDKYQGIPIKGYTRMIELMLDGIAVVKDDFCENIGTFKELGNKFIYTGLLHDLVRATGEDYAEVGNLKYRSLEFRHIYSGEETIQGASVINDCRPKDKIAYTRTIEHKFFSPENTLIKGTVLTEEYPREWKINREAYYPINNDETQRIVERTQNFINSRLHNRVLFLGRNAQYRYLDMDKAIEEAMNLCKNLIV